MARARPVLAALTAGVVAVTAWVFPGGAAADPVAASEPTDPNVVVVLLDDARLDDLSTMPAVGSLIGDQGATFEHAISPFPLCCPARATLLTGQYAHNHGVLDNAPPHGGFAAFDDSETLATWLDPTYATGWVGKYLNGYGADGTRRYVPPGWDSWAAPTSGWANYRSPTLNIDGTMTDFPGRYQTDVVGDLAVDFVTSHAGDGEPFFLTTSILAPHAGKPADDDDWKTFPSPNVADEYRDALSDWPLTDSPAFNEADVSDKPVRPSPLRGWHIKALSEVNQQRRESMLSAEDVVERLVTALADTDELDNTYLVFTSDNGYVLGEHRLRGGKVYPYEVATRVPLLVRGPGIAPGTVVDQLAGQQDLAPTVLDVTRTSVPSESVVLDGVSLLELADDPMAYNERPIVLEAGPATASATGYQFHGIRTPEWKYVERDEGGHELYDLANDPYELENKYRQPGYLQVKRQLRALLRQYEYCAGAVCR